MPQLIIIFITDSEIHTDVIKKSYNKKGTIVPKKDFMNFIVLILHYYKS